MTGAGPDGRQHYDPVFPHSRVLVVACAVATVVLVAIAWVAVPAGIARTSIIAAIIVTAVSAFLAGNAFRLRDVRRRLGNKLRHEDDSLPAKAALPPKATVEFRIRLAVTGGACGCAALVLTPLLAYVAGNSSSVTRPLVIVAILGLVLAFGAFHLATYSRPLD